MLLSSVDHKTATLKLADFGQSKVLSNDMANVDGPGLTGGIGELSPWRGKVRRVEGEGRKEGTKHGLFFFDTP